MHDRSIVMLPDDLDSYEATSSALIFSAHEISTRDLRYRTAQSNRKHRAFVQLEYLMNVCIFVDQLARSEIGSITSTILQRTFLSSINYASARNLATWLSYDCYTQGC